MNEQTANFQTPSPDRARSAPDPVQGRPLRSGAESTHVDDSVTSALVGQDITMDALHDSITSTVIRSAEAPLEIDGQSLAWSPCRLLRNGAKSSSDDNSAKSAKAADPTLDVSHGAIASLVIRPAATFLELARQTFATARRSSSLTALLSGGSDLSREMLDELAASYRVTRRSGALASGTVRVFCSADVYVAVGMSVRFEAAGIRFGVRSVQTAHLSTDPAPTLPDDRNLRPANDGSGRYFFDIPLTAETVGSGGNVVKGTEFRIVGGNSPYIVRVVALETFTGGENDESDVSLVERMRLGLSAKVLGSRTNMKAALLDHFPDIRDSSVIGAGDVEMIRDKHSVFPGSTGGYTDWYVGTTRQLRTTTLETDKFFQTGENPDGSVDYLVYLEDSDISCVYAVTSVQSETDLAYLEVTEQKHVVADSTVPNAPIVFNDAEAAFSAYQTVILTVRSPRSLAGEKLLISAIHMPGIREIQDWVLRCGQAPIGLDVLVKGAIPTTVRFSCVIHSPIGEDVDLEALQGRMADHVNHVDFGGILSVSGLVRGNVFRNTNKKADY